MEQEKRKKTPGRSPRRAITGGHRPVCVKCKVELKPKKNSVLVLSIASFGPASIWNADLWRCSRCGYEIIMGFAANPFACHYEPGFKDLLKKVDYCFKE
jgi:predicted RNA-binding Zn-ribbon protein involved in translation (DUF1610 family)